MSRLGPSLQHAPALLASITMAALLGACGGGSQQDETASPPQRPQAVHEKALATAPAAEVDATSAANQLMDFGETSFPQFFPNHETTRSLAPYLYRYYAGTQTYLGVASGAVYVMGGSFGDAPLYVGLLSSYITPVAPAPAITTQPEPAQVPSSSAARFSAAGTAYPAPTYQWQQSVDGGTTFSSIAGATAATFVTAPTTAADSGRQFRVVLSNSAGTATSLAARLTVIASTPSFTAATPRLATARANHAATLLNLGKLLITGGDTGSPKGQNFGDTLATAEWYDPATQTFTPLAARMTLVREGHTATLLSSGEVLITGGFDNQGSDEGLKSAELFDPVAGTFTALSATMTSARSHHAATLLADGRVLITGGAASGTSAASAEIYDPTRRSFSLLPATMKGVRSGHTATLLPSGQVLLAGGVQGSSGATARVLDSAELYDPASATFSTLPMTLVSARTKHSATALPDGRVLLAGGLVFTGGEPVALESAELFDPATRSFLAASTRLASARGEHTATTLPDGRILLTGGTPRYNGSAVLASTEVFQPPTAPTASFRALAGTMKTARSGHSMTMLPNGKILLAGGTTDDNNPACFSSAELYDPATDRWTPTGSMVTPHAWHGATLLANGKVLLAGGQCNNSTVASAELYDPATGTWAATGSLITGRQLDTMIRLPNGKVLVAGGPGGPGPTYTLASAELYDPATGGWSATGSMANQRRSFSLTLLPNGKVLAAGGAIKYTTTVWALAELYDPATGIWTATGALGAARHGHTAVPLLDGQVLVAGGCNCAVNSDAGPFLTTAEIYNPATGSWAPTGSLPAVHYYGSLAVLGSAQVLSVGGYDGSNALATADLYDPAIARWTPGPSMVTPRVQPSLFRMPSGQVLVLGGYDANHLPLATGEVFTP